MGFVSVAYQFEAAAVQGAASCPGGLPMEAAAASHTGRVRRTNQDAWGYSLEAGLFVVCDGMGGAAGGEVASQCAVEAFLEYLNPALRMERTSKGIERAVGAANRRVHGQAAAETALRGMGTTLVALVGLGKRRGEDGRGQGVAIAHVGDSRCYRWRRGALMRCTDDHSLVAEQLRMGVVTEEQAACSPMRSVITRAVGTRRSVAAEVRELTVEPGDVFLLCSDGLTRELPEAAIAVLLARAGSLEERNASLVEAAERAGGRDNVTCLLVQC